MHDALVERLYRGSGRKGWAGCNDPGECNKLLTSIGRLGGGGGTRDLVIPY